MLQGSTTGVKVRLEGGRKEGSWDCQNVAVKESERTICSNSTLLRGVQSTKSVQSGEV